MTDCVVVLVTCKSSAEARRVARAAVASRHAACANILPGKIESIYRWKGRVERARETLLLLKTTRRAWPKLRDTIRRAHSYDVPEIVALPIVGGLKQYLEWIGENVEGN
ncbi:MAG: divalent-cation tolerance protein CutA [Candidatus Acidiferrales bacterium]|jgi:periplasmic divalent cation tolerance protein